MESKKIKTNILFKITFLYLAAYSVYGCKENPHYKPTYSHSEINKEVLTVGCANTSFYEPMDLIIQSINKDLKDIRLKVVTGSNFEDYQKRLSQGEFDMSFINGLEGLKSEKTGYQIVAKFQEDSTYYGIYFANKNANLKTIKDLKGKKFAFASKGSIFGELAPAVDLYKNGLNPYKDINAEFYPSFESGILNVYLGNCDAGISWVSSWQRYVKLHSEIPKKLKVIGKTPSFPNICIIIKKDIDPKISEQILNTYLNLDKKPEGKSALLKSGFTKIVTADSTTYIPLKNLKAEFDLIPK